MNGSARSRSERKKDWSDVGVSGRMKLSVTVYNSANVPNVATVFSNTYSGRILGVHQHLHAAAGRGKGVARTGPSAGTRARTRATG
jgi:hypothetical protein